MNQVDLLVVGGGINGTGIARDAAGRGLSVLLVEKDDLGAHTSSASSKLIHGGLRYLEQFEFKLVRESLAERERLLRAAPHIVRPLEFVIPISEGSRPAWMLRAGLFLYDHLRRRTILPATAAIHLTDFGLRPEIDRGLSYWDCQVQDSRLVVLNAVDAAERGAAIRTHTEMTAARREGGRWIARLRSSGHEHSVQARALVNAAGPWAEELFGRVARGGTARHLRLVKGSHIVLRRLHDGERAFLLQNGDGRVVFAIPFEEKFTLVGTTDVECAAPAEHPAISEEETDYLLETVRRYFVASASRDDIVWSYSGIRALCDGGSSEPSKASRDYALDLEASGPPLLSVFGGKITTYRCLAEQTLDRLAPYLPTTKGAWTKHSTLPGGAIPDLDVHAYTEALADRLPALPRVLIGRLVRTYGTRSEQLLEGVRRVDDLGEHFGAGLYAREVDYLVANEWARTAEDILYRRTKLGLHLPGSADRLDDYLTAVVPSPGSPARRRLRRPAPGLSRRRAPRE